MTTLPGRLEKLEHHFDVGVCLRCRDLPRLAVRMPSDLIDDAGDGICPECGKREPDRLVIVITTREDGPQ